MEIIRAAIANRACRFGEAVVEGKGKCLAAVILLGHPPVGLIKKLGVFPWVSGDSVTQQDDMQCLVPDKPVRNLSLGVGKIDNGVALKYFPGR